MGISPATPSEPGSPNSPREPVKYRGSCDRCQNIKLRCSQDKPACKRCACKGVSCVYSPQRRIGRPRKAVQIAPVDTSLDEHTPAPGTVASTPGSSLSDSHQGYSDGPTTDFTSMGSVTSAIITPQNDLGSWDSGIADTLMIEPNNGSIGNDTQTVHPFQPGHASSTSNGGIQRPGMNSLALDRQLSVGMHTGAPAQASNAGTYTRPQETSLRTALHTLVDGPITQNAPDPVADCYIAILTWSTKLEQSLITAPRAPPIDLVLEAERNLRALKQRLFTCTGHAHNGRDCLASDRPVLLSLSLLAERVVTMLEETFRLAAGTASPMDLAIQDPSGNLLSATTARRLERSFRGLLDQPCVFPIPAGNLDIRVGDYVVDGVVKGRAVKGILQLRVRKLLGALEGMRRVPRRRNRGDSLGGPLDWGGSASVLEDAAGLLVEDLIRRMEALQGGMALMG